MTERGLPIVDGAPACPFVAFEDDRDERATSPDHRHRCFAEPRPAPRALAHQEAYCLSSAFPVCPTFQDWARREAAHSRSDGPRLTDSAGVGDVPTPQRNPPRNWSAPPPWAARTEPEDADEDDWGPEAAAAAAAAGAAGGAELGDEVPARGRGLSGSFADRVASGTSEAELGSMEADADAERNAPPSSMAGAAGANRQRERDPGRASAYDVGHADRGAPPPARHERRRDSDAPEWERARPLEVYPTLRSRRLPELSVPPLLVAVVALALAAAVLFALPGLLGFGSPSAVSSPTPSVAASVAAESVAPTPVPEPTPVTYIVKAGDTMSKIAKRFGVTLDDLIAANAATIPDPDKLAIGDVVIIPVPASNEVPDASVAPAPS